MRVQLLIILILEFTFEFPQCAVDGSTDWEKLIVIEGNGRKGYMKYTVDGLVSELL